ncbi:Endonuclease/Exonuclease/phosphatase family protein [Modicisalibacter ilicicola DSM 19980]|uniref:Endonuclease/Exonuclease/phosphatase family protein n=1 Tax=Modicisalibacter ilicicola DSM 19980 TaxID=1121942 RepID=A0A1M4W302_9GAMM|nr:Endonuclease/Exonuclease/phosphatase family protein [Halomonas ilicicola DSM 19980]
MEYASGAVVFLDPEELFAREPYSARFRDVDTGQEFATATVHIVFGDGVSDRLPEIDALADYWQWLGDVYPDSPRLLMGDFNLSPDHPSWEALRRLGAEPAITDGRTTLGTTAGYASLYDNIWYEADSLSPSDQGILKFPALLPLDHVTARERVSDHAPVYIGLNGGRLTPISTGGGQSTRQRAASTSTTALPAGWNPCRTSVPPGPRTSSRAGPGWRGKNSPTYAASVRGV